MCGHIACVAAVLLGVDAGWQRLPEGGMLYIIQIEPELIDTLRSGEPIQSDLRPEIRDVRALQIVVGTAELPREEPPPEVGPADAEPGARPPADPFLSSPLGTPDWPLSRSGVPSWPPGTSSPEAPAGDARPSEPSEPTPADAQHSPSEEEVRREEPPPVTRPWGWLIVALFTLSGSLGANVYLGWIIRGTRGRYRALLEDAADPGSFPGHDGFPGQVGLPEQEE